MSPKEETEKTVELTDERRDIILIRNLEWFRIV